MSQMQAVDRNSPPPKRISQLYVSDDQARHVDQAAKVGAYDWQLRAAERLGIQLHAGATFDDNSARIQEAQGNELNTRAERLGFVSDRDLTSAELRECLESFDAAKWFVYSVHRHLN